MAENQHPIAGEIVDTFKAGLSNSVCEQIGSTQFADLATLIDEAIRSEIASAADRVEDVARKLRARARGPELGL